uniref:Uncharacterized LOC103174897 n=1 Tax=Callorhinchus milii TaxID=7868 RepID=A0A4W3JET2_CALMI|eukprot:gi/632941128/ref/XP_007885698.1/ PREDICTED: uncharacterized protein LOC103174897 isoform X1 [Callorhinchus milii]
MSAPGGASEGTTLLLILWVSIAGSAQPQVSLSPEHIIITNGSAGFLRCDATGFYPQEILFRWVKVSHGRETDIIPSDFSTEYKGTNRDGTFSVSSQLRIRPNLDDDGNKYMCVVTHRTLSYNIVREAMLNVEESTIPWPIVGGVVGGVSLVLLLVLVLWCCCKKQIKGTKKGVPPRISELRKPDQFKHGVASRMNWEVTGFIPRMITITLLVRRKGKEPQPLYEWNLKNNEDPLEYDEKGLLLNSSYVLDGNNKEDSITAAIAKCVKQDDGTFSLKSTITICPDASEDDGAEVTLKVQHETLGKPLTSSVKLVIARVPPRISELIKPKQFMHGVESCMNWEVTGFTPRMITITLILRRKGKEPQTLYEWNLKNNEDPLEYDEEGLLLNSSYVLDGNKKEDSITAAIAKCIQLFDGTFSVKCTITVCPDASEDDGAEVTLKVQHETLGKPLTPSVKLVIARVPPRISELSKTDQFTHGEESRTGWEVTGFTPRMITITLIVRRKGKEPQPLYEWNFKKNEDPLEYDEKGLLLNSSCILNGNKKEDSITASISKCVQLDDGTFSVKGMIIICPDASEDDGAEVTLKVHHESLKNPLASSVKLVIVGVAPTVTEIDLRPEIKHSEVASLSWSVTGFTPKPISIVFLLKRKGELKEKRLFHWRIPENGGIDDEAKMGSTALTDVRDRCEEDDAITTVTPHCVRKNNGTFSVNCSIWMTADMCRDDGAELIVEVYHKALKTPLTKTMALHVTGVPPQITEIKKPSEITPGELASLSWAVVGFSPRAISIVTFVKRKGEQKKKKVFHWRIPKKDGEPQEAKTASVPLENVTEGCEEDGSFTAVMPHYVRKNNGMFSVNCSVWMCADLSKDDGAELMVEVVHEALKVPLIGSVTLQVTDGGN